MPMFLPPLQKRRAPSIVAPRQTPAPAPSPAPAPDQGVQMGPPGPPEGYVEPKAPEPQNPVQQAASAVGDAVGGAVEAAKRLYLFPLVGHNLNTLQSLYPFGKPQTVTPGYQGKGIGPVNNGADLGVPQGTKIQAVAKGVVLEARTFDPTNDSGWGNYIRYRDEYGVIHRHAHLMDPPDLRPGDEVAQGQVIARVGKTGNATGPHLDWEFYENGEFKDPLANQFVEPDTMQAIQAQAAPPTRGESNEQIIRRVAQEEGVDPDLAVAVARQESGLDPHAHNPNGEDSWGLFQLNRNGGMGTGIDPSKLVDPEFNARVSLRAMAETAKRTGLTGGALAAASQRPFDPKGYATSVDKILLGQRGTAHEGSPFDPGEQEVPEVIDPVVEGELPTPTDPQAPDTTLPTAVTTPAPEEVVDPVLRPIITPERDDTNAPPTPTTEDPEALRGRLRAAGLPETVVDQLTGYRGAYKMRRLRRVPEVFAPKPEQVDGERVADILQVVARDARVDPVDISNVMQDFARSKGIVDEEPGTLLFDMLWPTIAENTGIPTGGTNKDAKEVGDVLWRPPAVSAKRARELIAGATEEPLEGQVVYHGTGKAFTQVDTNRFDPQSLRGPGLYLTTSSEVAGSGDPERPGYAESRQSGVLTKLNSVTREIAEVEKELDSLRSGPLRQAFLDAGETEEQIERRIADDYHILVGLRMREEELAVSGGEPNIRPVLVPGDLRLLDLEQPAPSKLVERVMTHLENLGDGGWALEKFMRYAAADTQTGDLLNEPINGHVLWRAIHAAGEEEGEWTNHVLSEAGYDGLKHKGGTIRPMRGADNKPIEHQVTVIFPEAVGRVTSPGGLAQGPVETDRALLQVWAEANPKLVESLAALLGFKWTKPDSAPEHTPSYVNAVGSVVPEPWGGAGFEVEFANVPNEAQWNRMVARLAATGVAPVEASYEGGRGTVRLLAATEETANEVQAQLTAYAQAVPGGWGTQSTEIDVSTPRQPSLYEIVPRLFTRNTG